VLAARVLKGDASAHAIDRVARAFAFPGQPPGCLDVNGRLTELIPCVR